MRERCKDEWNFGGEMRGKVKFLSWCGGEPAYRVLRK